MHSKWCEVKGFLKKSHYSYVAELRHPFCFLFKPLYPSPLCLMSVVRAETWVNRELCSREVNSSFGYGLILMKTLGLSLQSITSLLLYWFWIHLLRYFLSWPHSCQRPRHPPCLLEDPSLEQPLLFTFICNVTCSASSFPVACKHSRGSHIFEVSPNYISPLR